MIKYIYSGNNFENFPYGRSVNGTHLLNRLNNIIDFEESEVDNVRFRKITKTERYHATYFTDVRISSAP